MIELKNVYKSYNSITGITEILNNVSYVFPDTGFIALCGRSGCGKTTLFNMISGVDQDYLGTILYDGEDIKSLDKSKREDFYSNNIFYLKSRDNFIKNITVKEALEVYLSKDAISKAYNLIKQFELEYLVKKKIKKLSSGELQKISIIIAVCKNAKITLLDEPICNIDEASVKGFLTLIKDLSKNSLVLYISHYEDDYDDYFTHKLSLEDGNILINKSSDTFSTARNSTIKSSFSLKKSLIIEKSKPLGLYTLFRLIILMLVAFLIYVTKINNISISDIYINSLDEMSVNIVHTTRSNDSVIEKKRIYSSPFKRGDKHDTYLNSINYTTIKGFGRASDFVFSNLNQELENNEIIISDYFAYCKKITIGDEIKVRKASSDNYKVSYDTTYVIKHIFETNYKALLEKDNYQIPDEYYYVFISDKEMDKIINDSLNSYGGVWLNNAYVAPYDEHFVETGYYNSVSKDGYYDLKDDEFLGGILALSFFGLKEISGNMDIFLNGSDEYYDVVFNLNDLTLTKRLKYRKSLEASEYLVVSDSLFKELKEYFNINSDNVLNYTLIDTFDVNNDKVADYFKSLDKFSELSFLNDEILTNKMSKVNALITFYKTNYFYILSFFAFFIILAIIKLTQIELEYYKLLKEKNYKSRTNILIFLCSKIIVYLIISIICIAIYNFMIVL